MTKQNSEKIIEQNSNIKEVIKKSFENFAKFSEEEKEKYYTSDEKKNQKDVFWLYFKEQDFWKIGDEKFNQDEFNSYLKKIDINWSTLSEKLLKSKDLNSEVLNYQDKLSFIATKLEKLKEYLKDFDPKVYWTIFEDFLDNVWFYSTDLKPKPNCKVRKIEDLEKTWNDFLNKSNFSIEVKKWQKDEITKILKGDIMKAYDKESFVTEIIINKIKEIFSNKKSKKFGEILNKFDEIFLDKNDKETIVVKNINDFKVMRNKFYFQNKSFFMKYPQIKKRINEIGKSNISSENINKYLSNKDPDIIKFATSLSIIRNVGQDKIHLIPTSKEEKNIIESILGKLTEVKRQALTSIYPSFGSIFERYPDSDENLKKWNPTIFQKIDKIEKKIIWSTLDLESQDQEDTTTIDKSDLMIQELKFKAYLNYLSLESPSLWDSLGKLVNSKFNFAEISTKNQSDIIKFLIKEKSLKDIKNKMPDMFSMQDNLYQEFLDKMFNFDQNELVIPVPWESIKIPIIFKDFTSASNRIHVKTIEDLKNIELPFNITILVNELNRPFFEETELFTKLPTQSNLFDNPFIYFKWSNGKKLVNAWYKVQLETIDKKLKNIKNNEEIRENNLIWYLSAYQPKDYNDYYEWDSLFLYTSPIKNPQDADKSNLIKVINPSDENKYNLTVIKENTSKWLWSQFVITPETIWLLFLWYAKWNKEMIHKEFSKDNMNPTFNKLDNIEKQELEAEPTSWEDELWKTYNYFWNWLSIKNAKWVEISKWKKQKIWNKIVETYQENWNKFIVPIQTIFENSMIKDDKTRLYLIKLWIEIKLGIYISDEIWKKTSKYFLAIHHLWDGTKTIFEYTHDEVKEKFEMLIKAYQELEKNWVNIDIESLYTTINWKKRLNTNVSFPIKSWLLWWYFDWAIVKNIKPNPNPNGEDTEKVRPDSIHWRNFNARENTDNMEDILKLNYKETLHPLKDIETWNTKIWQHNIIRPDKFYNQIKSLVERQYETTGVIIASKKKVNWIRYYVPEYFRVLANWSATEVTVPSEYIDAVNKLSQENPDIKLIQWHTHPKSVDPERYTKFSDQDRTNFITWENTNYIHTLFSPTSILTFGRWDVWSLHANTSNGVWWTFDDQKERERESKFQNILWKEETNNNTNATNIPNKSIDKGNKKPEAKESSDKEFMEMRDKIKWCDFKWYPNWWFVMWTELWIDNWPSELPPHWENTFTQSYWTWWDYWNPSKKWFKMRIVNITKDYWEIEINGGELKLQNIEWKRKRLPKTKASLEMINKIFKSSNIYKLPNSDNASLSNQLKTVLWSGMLTNNIWWVWSGTWNIWSVFSDGIQCKDDWFYFSKNNEQWGKEWDKVEYFGIFDRVYEIIPKDELPKDTRMGWNEEATDVIMNPIMYKVEHITKWWKKMFKVISNFQLRDNKDSYKLKSYSYEREMDYNNFLLFVWSKKLRAFPKDKAEKAQRSLEREWNMTEPSGLHRLDEKPRWLKFFSTKEISDVVKGVIKNPIDIRKERDKENKEYLEDFLMSDLKINKHLSNLFGVFGFQWTDQISASLDQSDADRFKWRQDRIWKKIERWMKIFEADWHTSSLLGDKILPILTWKEVPRDKYKIAAALLFQVKKWWSPYRNAIQLVGTWTRVKLILWEDHHARYLRQRDTYYRHLKDSSVMGTWKDDKWTDLVSLEIEYITGVIDWRYQWIDAPSEYYRASVRSRQYADELNNGYKKSKSLDNIESKVKEYNGDKKSFDMNHAEFIRYYRTWRPIHALVHLKLMAFNANTHDQLNILRMIILSFMLAWGTETILWYEWKKMLWRISRSIWFLPWLWARWRHSQYLTERLLNLGTNNRFTKETWFDIKKFSLDSDDPKKFGIENWLLKVQNRRHTNDNGRNFMKFISDDIWNPWTVNIVNVKEHRSLSTEEENVVKDYIGNSFEWTRENAEHNPIKYNMSMYYMSNPFTFTKWVVQNVKATDDDEKEALESVMDSIIEWVGKAWNLKKNWEKWNATLCYMFKKFTYRWSWSFANRKDVLARSLWTVKKIYDKWKQKLASGNKEEWDKIIQEAKNTLRFMTVGRVIEQKWALEARILEALKKFWSFFQENMEDLLKGENMWNLGLDKDLFENKYFWLHNRTEFDKAYYNQDPSINRADYMEEATHINPMIKRMESALQDDAKVAIPRTNFTTDISIPLPWWDWIHYWAWHSTKKTNNLTNKNYIKKWTSEKIKKNLWWQTFNWNQNTKEQIKKVIESEKIKTRKEDLFKINNNTPIYDSKKKKKKEDWEIRSFADYRFEQDMNQPEDEYSQAA